MKLVKDAGKKVIILCWISGGGRSFPPLMLKITIHQPWRNLLLCYSHW